MKKGLSLLMILTLAMAMILMSCDQSGQDNEQENESYLEEYLRFASPPAAGEDSCFIVGIENTGGCKDKELKIPSKSPEGKTVTKITISPSYDASGFNGIESIYIPDSIIGITRLSRHCANLSEITVSKDNTKFYSENNCLIETETGELIMGSNNSIIPKGVTSIGAYAFYNRQALTSIIIPNTVTSIGPSAFAGCPGLDSIVIPDSVTSISDGAFYKCTELTDVYYTGTEEEWTAIVIEKSSVFSDVSFLSSATIHYNYVPEE